MPKVVDPDEKREELVEASWEVIANEGLKAATMRRVAAEAGYTTGALTHYFADRRSLLVAALRAAHYQAAVRMAEAAQCAKTPEDRLRAVLLESLPLDEQRLREWRIWLAFWAESTNDPELAEEDENRYAEWRELLKEAITPIIGRGARVRHEVDHLVALVDGLGVRIARGPHDDAAFAAQRRECKAVLARHLDRLAMND